MSTLTLDARAQRYRRPVLRISNGPLNCARAKRPTPTENIQRSSRQAPHRRALTNRFRHITHVTDISRTHHTRCTHARTSHARIPRASMTRFALGLALCPHQFIDINSNDARDDPRAIHTTLSPFCTRHPSQPAVTIEARRQPPPSPPTTQSAPSSFTLTITTGAHVQNAQARRADVAARTERALLCHVEIYSIV